MHYVLYTSPWKHQHNIILFVKDSVHSIYKFSDAYLMHIIQVRAFLKLDLFPDVAIIGNFGTQESRQLSYKIFGENKCKFYCAIPPLLVCITKITEYCNVHR